MHDQSVKKAIVVLVLVSFFSFQASALNPLQACGLATMAIASMGALFSTSFAVKGGVEERDCYRFADEEDCKKDSRQLLVWSVGGALVSVLTILSGSLVYLYGRVVAQGKN